MRALHLFNPENDLALAANIANYTPPRAAVRLAQAGALLPLWYGAPGDMALCYGVPAKWYGEICESFGIGVGIYPHSCEGLSLAASPWGWSLSARQAFIDDGFPQEALPTDEHLANMRELSHRRTALDLASDLIKDGIEGIASPGVEISDSSELSGLLDKPRVLKMPWSSSGRGVVDSRIVGKDRAVKFGIDCIRRQGSVMVETAYDRALDFAKIFRCHDGVCSILGTSVFLADERGAYLGNLLASEAERRRAVADKTDICMLDAVCETLRQSVERRIAPFYNGVLGVDMLADRNGMLNPCVELNLRKTMGYVANCIADRYIGIGQKGIFKVVSKRPGEYKKQQGAAIENHRLQQGCISLIPENQYFSIFAQIGDEGIKA